MNVRLIYSDADRDLPTRLGLVICYKERVMKRLLAVIIIGLFLPAGGCDRKSADDVSPRRDVEVTSPVSTITLKINHDLTADQAEISRAVERSADLARPAVETPPADALTAGPETTEELHTPEETAARRKEQSAQMAKDIISMMANDEFASVLDVASPQFAQASSADKLRDAWQNLEKKLGTFSQVTSTTVAAQGEEIVTDSDTEFPRGFATIRVVFNRQDQVAGLFMGPARAEQTDFSQPGVDQPALPQDQIEQEQSPPEEKPASSDVIRTITQPLRRGQ